MIYGGCDTQVKVFQLASDELASQIGQACLLFV